MTQIPTISAGDDFDKQVLYRAWVRSLPQPPVPDGFDATVLRAARSGALSHWWGLAIVVAFLAGVGGLTFFSTPSQVVRVSSVPPTPLPVVNLYHLPPAPAVEEIRFVEQPADAAPRARHGVAGY